MQQKRCLVIGNKIFLMAVFLSLSVATEAQVKITDSNNTEPNSQSILHLESKDNNKGFLLPRVALQSLTQASPLTNHVEGMVVFNTNPTAELKEQIYYNDGTKWVEMSTDQSQPTNPEVILPKVGEVKHSLQEADHSGWYLLDGRTKASLPNVTVRNNATSVGIGNNLPNVQDSYLKGFDATNGLRTISGNSTTTVVLTEANLPTVEFSGTTSTDGEHTHEAKYIDANGGKLTLFSANSRGSRSVISDISEGGELSDVTTNNGEHTHTGTYKLGNGQSIDIKPRTLLTNVFVYLGQ